MKIKSEIRNQKAEAGFSQAILSLAKKAVRAPSYFAHRISFGFRISVLGFATLSSLHASPIYETSSEFLGSGDFNGDGITDVLVFDKATGNARVGYQNTNSALTWSAPLLTGVENASGCAIGNFLQADRDDLAVTALDLNRVPLLILANTNSASSPYSVTPNGIGAHTLIALPKPRDPPAQFDTLFIASAFNHPIAEQIDLVGFFPGPLTSTSGPYSETGLFERGNALQLETNGLTFAVGLVRGNTNDTLHIWQFTNSPNVMVALSNLPPGSDYAFGNFDGETLPRFWFYAPGQSNITIRPLLANGDGYAFGDAISLNFTQAVQKIYYVAENGDGSAFIQFGDGIQGVKLRDGAWLFAPKYSTGGGATGNVFTGIADLEDGRFALLSAPLGTLISVQARVMTFDGTNYTQISSNNLSPLTTRNTRATVWLFQTEPFTNTAAALLGSVNAPDWSSGIISLSGPISVRVENDSGAASGLGSATTNNFGNAPSGTTYALANQYRNDISFFSYTPPRSPEQFAITIAPPPGSYGGPIQISFIKTNFVTVFYRIGAANAWQAYSTPFSLTNDSTIQYYGRISNGPRGRIQYASYTLGRSNLPPESPVTLPNDGGGSTNPPPPIPLPGTVISANGTIFYSRSDSTIWTINFDGSGDQLVTTGGYNPRVSPDGNYMLFFRGGIGTMLRNMQTGVETQIHPSYHSVVGYDWERDSQKFVIDYQCSIWSGDLAGNFTPYPPGDCNDDAPVVNPADGSLAYHNFSGNAAIRGIYVMPPPRTTRTNLNLNLTTPGWPSWSPNGGSLAVRAAKPNTPGESANNLWLLNADGTNVRQITALGANDGFPFGAIWSPDGKALVTAGSVWGTNGLWVLHLSADGQYCGCAPVRLPTTPGAAIGFAGTVVVPPDFIPDLKPGLFIRQENDAVIVYWSTNYAGYALQSTIDLLPNEWTPIQGPYFLVGDTYEYREANAILAPHKFFRLKSPAILILTPEPQPSMQSDSNDPTLNRSLNYVGYASEPATNRALPALFKSYDETNEPATDDIQFRKNLP